METSLELTQSVKHPQSLQEGWEKNKSKTFSCYEKEKGTRKGQERNEIFRKIPQTHY